MRYLQNLYEKIAGTSDGSASSLGSAMVLLVGFATGALVWGIVNGGFFASESSRDQVDQEKEANRNNIRTTAPSNTDGSADGDSREITADSGKTGKTAEAINRYAMNRLIQSLNSSVQGDDPADRAVARSTAKTIAKRMQRYNKQDKNRIREKLTENARRLLMNVSEGSKTRDQ